MKSIGRGADRLRPRAGSVSASQMPSRPIGTLIRKIQCQLKIGGDEAADRRPDQRADQRRDASATPCAETSSLLRRRRAPAPAAPTGVIIAPPMPCRKRASTKVEQRAGDGAGDRAEDEDADRDAEDRLGAEAVGHPAADRDEDGERDEIGGQRQLQRDRARCRCRAAIAGSDVAITVESMFSMNRATARMSGMVRFNVLTGMTFWSFAGAGAFNRPS